MGNLTQKNGKFGEQVAKQYLEDCGYEILAVNWRFKRWEADLIAKQEDILVFVEVKTRSSLAFGHPDEFVDEKKRQHMLRLARAYIDMVRHDSEIRFDIVSVYTKQQVEIRHIKDAFWEY